MVIEQSSSSESLWQLSGFAAQLQAASLVARIDLQSPALGLKGLTWKSAPLIGSVLGIDLSQSSKIHGKSIGALVDGFARGSDLVAKYPETQSQPFTLEVYWRVAATESDQVQIDAIVSLQTSLLECYPTVQTITSLAAQEAWFVPSSGSKARLLAHEVSPEQTTSSDEFAGVVLRSADRSWSYLEMTHPEDLGTWQADCEESGKWRLQRLLGGEFQEKGVIRRLRVRGVFLPQEEDIEIASRLLREFASSPSPLTA